MRRFFYIGVLWLAVFGFAFSTGALGQSVTEPSLGLVFPLEEQGDTVVASQSVLINPYTIIPKGARMLNVFEMPVPGDDDVKVADKPERGIADSNFSRKGSHKFVNQKEDELSSLQKAALRRAFATVWNKKLSFQAAFHRLPGDRMRIVYQEKPDGDPLIRAFNPPQGLFLIEGEGFIEIAGTVKGSHAEKEGVPAKAQLLAVNDISLNGKLEIFLKHYAEEKEKKQKLNQPLNLTIRFESTTEPKVIAIPLPKTLQSNGLFNDLVP